MKPRDPALFNRFTRRIQTEMKRLGVPGAAVGVIHQGHESFRGFGVTSVENPLPVTNETLFQAGSVTKLLTGTLAMILAEKKKLRLEEPVRKYIPKFEMRDPEVTRR